MLGMGHLEAAGNVDADNPEIHSAMTATRAFREDSKAFVNLSIYEQRLHRSMKEALMQSQTDHLVLYVAVLLPRRRKRSLLSWT